RKYRYSFYVILSSVLFSPAYGISTFIIVFWTSILAILCYWVFSYKNERRKILYAVSFFILTIILWSLAHAWWLGPIIFSGNAIYSGHLDSFNENIGTLLGVSQNYPPFTLIRLLQK